MSFPIMPFMKKVDEVTLLTNLLSYYNFDESSGNLLDIHGSEDFSLTGPPTQGAPGKINDAYDFNGTTDYCTSINSTPWDLQASDFSVSLWFKRDVTGAFQFLLDSRFDAGKGWGFSINGDQILVSFKAQDVSFGSVNDTNWHHLAFVRDSDGVATVYIDNVDEGTLSNVSDTGTLALNPRFGARAFTSPVNFMEGLIDECGIWRRILTVSEINLLYNSGNGLSYNGF